MAQKTVVRTNNAPAPFQGAPYSQAIRFGNLVFVSGQVATDPTTGAIVEGGIKEQTEQVLRNLEAILNAAGTSLTNALKATVYLTDFGDFAAMNEAYARCIGDEPPARATFQVAALPPGFRVEIEVIAHT